MNGEAGERVREVRVIHHSPDELLRPRGAALRVRVDHHVTGAELAGRTRPH